jgi:hypothetical protein
MHNVLNDFRPCCVWVWGTLGTKNVRRDIVDTYFHASRFPGTTQPNKHGFLLHEGKAERAFRADELRLISDVWLIMATTFVMLFEVDREDSLSSRPQTGGTTGWSWTELWMHLSIRLNWLGIGSWPGNSGSRLWQFLGPIKVEHLTMFAMRKDVDYLLIAKPVAFNHLGIHRGCASSTAMRPAVGSSLWRPWSLLLKVTGRNVSELCEIGEQGDLAVGFRSLLCRNAEHFLMLQLNLWPFDELLNEKVTLLLRLSCVAFTPSGGDARMESSYLVDPASSHMLVSKIKPCMSKYKQICTVKLRMAH